MGVLYTILHDEFENYMFEITSISTRGQRVKQLSKLRYQLEIT